MNIKIRPLCEADLRAAAEIERLCFSLPWSLDTLTGELAHGCLFWGAFSSGGDLLGYAALKTAADEGYMGNLAVQPEHRQKGAGQALLSAVIRHASKAGLRFVSLEVRVNNHPARALYEKNRFLFKGIRPKFYDLLTEDAAIYTLEKFER